MRTKPNCLRCHSDKNIVEFAAYWRCAFCGKIVWKTIKQTKLKFWAR